MFLYGTVGNDIRRAVAMSITVTEEAISDYRIDIVDGSSEIPVGGRGTFEIRLLSENGFSSPVNITIGPHSEGVKVTLSKNRVIPTDNLTAVVEGNITGGPYLIPILAIWEGKEKAAYIKVSFLQKVIGPSLSGPDSPVLFGPLEGDIIIATFDVLLSPGSEPLRDIELITPQLPDGYNVSYQPSDLGSLPYALNVTVRIWGPRGSMPDGMNFTLSDLEEDVVLSIFIPFTIEDGKSSGERFPYPFVILGIGSIVLLSALVYLFLIRRDDGSNHLKTPIHMDQKHAPPERGQLHKTRQLPHGGNRDMDRGVDKLR
jgi:hypothetical protein